MSDKKSFKSQAYSILKEKIIKCNYKPGSILSEAELANSLGFSRTPIREAINLLEAESFLKVIPKKGIIVCDILLNDIAEVFQVRMEVEPIALKLASPYLNMKEIASWKDKFTHHSSSNLESYELDMGMHMYLIESCKNSFIIDMMQKVFDKNVRIIVSSPKNEEHLQQACIDHIEILDFLLEKKFDKAAEKMREHIVGCHNAALDYFYKGKSR